METGAILLLKFVKKVGGYEVSLKFSPYEAQLIKINADSVQKKMIPQAVAGESKNCILQLDASDSWEISADRDNVLRLAKFEFAIDEAAQGLEKDWQRFADNCRWSTVDAKTFIDQCSDFYQSKSYQVRFDQDFGVPMKLKLNYPMIVWYRSQFKVNALPKVAKILMDAGAISGNYVIYLNGFPVTQADFSTEFHYDYQNKICDITKLLRKGSNHFAVRTVVKKDWDGVVDPLYIIGSFGVSFDSEGVQMLDVPPQVAKIQGAGIEGYPYYAGELLFKQRLKMERLPDETEFSIEFNHLDSNLHDCIELIINGQSLGAKPWGPYLWKAKGNLIQAGENEVQVKIINTLAGMLDGKYFDYNAHQLMDIR